MKPLGFYTLLTVALVTLCSMSASAQWVILTTGEKFQTDRSWHEDGRLKFRLNGLVVSVPARDVARVVMPENAAPTATTAANNTPAVTDALQSGRKERLLSSNKTPLPPSRQERLKNALRLPPPDPGGQEQSRRPTPVAQKTDSPGAQANSLRPPPTGQAPAASPPQTQRGTSVFRDLSWGMRPSSMPGLLLSQTNPAYGGVDEFYYPEENLRLGTAPLNGIVYGFWQNRLYTITIWTDGRPSYDKLRQWVLGTYGPGHQSDRTVERRVWYGDGTDRMLEFDDALNTGIFWMRSAKLHARIKQIQ